MFPKTASRHFSNWARLSGSEVKYLTLLSKDRAALWWLIPADPQIQIPKSANCKHEIVMTRGKIALYLLRVLLLLYPINLLLLLFYLYRIPRTFDDYLILAFLTVKYRLARYYFYRSLSFSGTQHCHKVLCGCKVLLFPPCLCPYTLRYPYLTDGV